MSIGSLLAAIGLLVANGFFVAVEFALIASRRASVRRLFSLPGMPLQTLLLLDRPSGRL